MEDLRSLGTRHEVVYQNEVVKELRAYRMIDNLLIFRDSLVYNSSGTIYRIYHYTGNHAPQLPLSWIAEFEYDSHNRAIQRNLIDPSTRVITSFQKYYWLEGNIMREEHYVENELHYEFFYEYDRNKSYKKGLPTSLTDPLSWSENNRIEMKWFDHYGNLDLICGPCKSKYKYNLDGYPVSMKHTSGREMKFRYE